MIIHSPIISGSLTFADGATFTLPDNGIYSGSFSGSVAGLGDPKTFSASLETKIQQLNIDTGSQDARLDLIESYTSSLETKNATLATYTGSVSSQLSNLNSATASYETNGRGIVSGSTQVTPLLPTGTISGSSQVTGIGNAQLTNSSITIGSTSTALGAASTTIAGLTSVTSTTFVGALTGNASTATTAAALTNARTINGTSFDGSANITIPNLVSGSAQISLGSVTGNSTTNVTEGTNLYYTDARVKTKLNAETVVSGSSQISLGSVTGNSTSNVTEGSNLYYTDARVKTKLNAETVVSGSSQITLSSVTGYASVINQNLLTTSDVTHNNVTVSGNLTVNGTTTTVNSTTLQIGDNIIELNGNGSANGGLLVKDPTAPNTVSGSLLWDSTSDYWKAGAAGSELPLATTTGTQTLTNKTIDGSQLVALSVANAKLANSSITINGNAVSLGGSTTVTATATNALTIGTGLSGTSYNGSAAVTITNTGVTSITTNTGLSTNASATGGVTITNTGVTSNVAGNGISLSGATGAVTITNSGVRSIAAGIGVAVSATTGDSCSISIGQSVATSASPTFAGLTINGAITATGDITAFSASDIRFKENITPIKNPLEKISKISGNSYDWKAENKDIHGFEGNDIGVIAQEIEEVLPQLVVTRDNGYKAVKYDKLVALLIEGMKEQQKQIEDLSNKINKLENEL